MNVVAIVGSTVGTSTKNSVETLIKMFQEQHPEHTITKLDLAEYDIEFSDGRNYIDYEGDTKYVAETIMNTDGIMIGMPIFQGSLPGSLKNVFDLLPINGLRDKVVSMLTTAGSSKHFLVAEHHLKPILAYMKAHIVPTYVFVEEKDMLNKQIVNDDVLFRMRALVDDTVDMMEAYASIRTAKEAEYDF